MKISECFPYTFKALHHALGHDVTSSQQPVWQQRLSADTDEQCHAYTLWYRMAQEASRMLGQTVTVSPLLELRATPDQKRRKIDLVDFLFESPPK